jgi:serine protease
LSAVLVSLALHIQPGHAQAPAPAAQRISIKFTEAQAVRIRSGALLASTAIAAPPPPPNSGALQVAQTQLHALHALLMTAPAPAGQATIAQSITPLMRDQEITVDQLTTRLRGEGKSIPDLNNYIDVTLQTTATPAQIAALLTTLQGFSIVQNVQRLPIEPPPPPQVVDIAPPTPDFSAEQLYLNAPGSGPNPTQIIGVGAAAAWALPGGKGRGVRVIDIEYIERPHEDIPALDAALSLAAGADVVASSYNDGHAVAVHGIIAAQHNGYGTQGLTPDVQYGLVSSLAAGFYVWNVPYAVAFATNRLRAGDVMLMEQQLLLDFNGGSATVAPFCRSAAGVGPILVPIESIVAVADAVRVATATGISVVMTASNGGCNLDAPPFTAFASASGNTGAIYVSSGTTNQLGAPITRAPTGARIDVQAWVNSIVTAGGGGGLLLVAGAETDTRQWYTSDFGGTSGAGAIVTGVAAAVQGIKRNYIRGRPYTPAELRTLLRTHVAPQPAADIAAIGRIGGMPVLSLLVPAILANPVCSPDYTPASTCNLDVDGDGTLGEWDGLLILRYLLGLRGAALVAGQPTPPVSCATRVTGTAVQSHIESLLATGLPLDIDGDGQALATTDGLLLLRALTNPGQSVATPTWPTGATRTDWNAIRTRLNTVCNANITL